MNPIYSGIILLVYSFVVIAAYIFISSPFDDMVSGFEDVNLTSSDIEVENSASYIRIVFDMSFAILLLGPIVWFILSLLRREPDWRYRQ